MKKIFLFLALFLITSTYVLSQDKIIVSISKNSAGELVMTVKGHTTPVTINVEGKEITLQVGESEVNLTALGINELTGVSVEEVDTAAGSEASTDAQATAAPIPPINPLINPNPPLSTPF